MFASLNLKVDLSLGSYSIWNFFLSRKILINYTESLEESQ